LRKPKKPPQKKPQEWSSHPRPSTRSVGAFLPARPPFVNNATLLTALGPHADWSNVGFKVREVNGHVSSTYSKTTGQWTAPEFVWDPYLRIHGMAPALNYGQQCYEGLKALRNPDDRSIHIFRPAENAKRMQHSASFVAMPAVPEKLFLECVHLAVARNAEYVPPSASGASMYIRPLLFGSSAQLGLAPPEEYTFLVTYPPLSPSSFSSSSPPSC